MDLFVHALCLDLIGANYLRSLLQLLGLKALSRMYYDR